MASDVSNHKPPLDHRKNAAFQWFSRLAIRFRDSAWPAAGAGCPAGNGAKTSHEDTPESRACAAPTSAAA
jgi:hypothetical protein